ncbi:MAG: SDR family NAD(P)-dependent oxidoreductase [Deferribacteres bacterium]|nr:SDR family NAD(P)-dependent oxidoreductase [candidate division KSB1 bacterium]MCB9508968.1 SDR family NAD(P)-dependent oxidoreductase [Deferribacteres bacterium]
MEKPIDPLLKNTVAVVAGATRGAGRGIACMLGAAGATVYCTGRSVRGKPASGQRPETIEETAEHVTERGGVGYFAQVDHTDEKQVQAFFERVKAEQGRLDLLVNDIWGGDALTEWGKPFWQLSIEQGKLMLDRAVMAHIITSRYGVPLMLPQRRGLVIEVTDGDVEINRHYRGNLFYDLAKISAMRLAMAMSQELRDHHIAALAITPGFLRSEAMLEHFSVNEDNWQDAAKIDPYFAESESPFYVGRAVAALAADSNILQKSGGAFSSWQLAEEYGFTDIDGRTPNFGRLMAEKSHERWLQLLAAIEHALQAELDSGKIEFGHSEEELILRTRKISAEQPSNWFSYKLTSVELLMGDLDELAHQFERQVRSHFA